MKVLIILSLVTSFFLSFQGGFCEQLKLSVSETKLNSDNVFIHNEPSKSTSATIEIHSSFSEEASPKPLPVVIQSSKLLTIDENDGVNEKVEQIILPPTESHNVVSNETEERYIVRAQPKNQTEVITPAPEEKEEFEEPFPGNETTVPLIRASPDDIPSFSEWTQQQLAERNRIHPNTTERVRTSKFRSKNYASPDCGAKIVANNQEAVGASYVLSSSRDEYMLNHCTARIWFIVELCEAIEAKQLDLANFELFSSSPKEFSVYVGSRFPTRDWSSVGRFVAKDSRDIQTFLLSPHLFGKYLKIEVHSHYGKEHYCPLSWVRVFGTSEYEVLATEDDRHNEDDDELTEEEQGDHGHRNLFSTATDAVLSIVKKATAPFLKAEEKGEVVRLAPSTCISPRYLTVCNNCSQHMYDNLFYLLSCQYKSLNQWISSPYVRRTLIQKDVCNKYGLDFVSLREGAPFPLPQVPDERSYLSSLLKESYVVALCNVLAVLENRVLVNMSVAYQVKNNTDLPNVGTAASDQPLLPSSTCDALSYATSTPEKLTCDPSYQISPTKTLREDEVNLQPIEIFTEAHTELATPDTTSQSMVPNNTPETLATPTENQLPSMAEATSSETKDSTEPSLDAILKDLSELERAVNQQPTSSVPPPGPHKDSIFLRLANRIKNLELNMSLSSSYLEELSRRYRQQLEALSQTLNVTATRLEEQARMEELRTRRRDEEMAVMKAQLKIMSKDLAALTGDRQSWFPRPIQIFWFSIELAVIWYFIKKWTKTPDKPVKQEKFATKNNVRKPKRRNSVGSLPEIMTEKQIERRPSDEALEIALSTHFSSAERKRKKKRKESNARKLSGVASAPKRKKSDRLSIENISETVGGHVPSGGCDYLQTPQPVRRQLSEPPPSLTVNAPVTTYNRFAVFSSPGERNTRPAAQELVRRFSSPGLFRTAMSSRAGRLSHATLQNETAPGPNKKESGFKKYMRKLF